MSSAKPSVLDLYLREAHSQLDEQYRRGRGFDSKVGAIIAIAAALAATAAIQLKDFSSAGPNGLPPAATVVAIIIAVAYSGAMAFSLIALLPRKKWFSGPRLDNLLEGFDEYPDTDPIRWAGRQVATSVTNNERKLGAKARTVFWAIVFAAAMGLGTIVLGIVVNYG